LSVVHLSFCLCCLPALRVYRQKSLGKMDPRTSFMRETTRSVLTTTSADRADVLRVRDALACGDVGLIDGLVARNRADVHRVLDEVTGEYPLHVAAASLGKARQRQDVTACLLWLLDDHEVVGDCALF